MELTAIGDKISVSECKQLAEDRKAIFVTDGCCALPRWLAKQCYVGLILEYHHPEFVGLRVGQLTCVEFSDKDEYQPLAAESCSASLPDDLWEEANKRGENKRRDAASSAKGPLSALVTLTSDSPTGLHGGAGKKSRGRELLSKAHAKSLLGGYGTAGATAYQDKNGTVTVKGHGVVMMLDGMGLAADKNDDEGGDDESVQAGGKRKRSGDTATKAMRTRSPPSFQLPKSPG